MPTLIEERLRSCAFCAVDTAGNHYPTCPNNEKNLLSQGEHGKFNNRWTIPPPMKIEQISSPPTQGWMCPRCQKVWAPWWSGCDCKPLFNLTFTDGTTGTASKSNEEGENS